MSVFKVVKYGSDSLAHLQDRLTYISRITATRSSYIYGVAVSEFDPYRGMALVKQSYFQDDGKTHYHYILNPEEEDFENVSLDDFCKVERRVAELIAGFYGHFQVISAIHTDGDYPHLHVIANNIDYENGQRFDLSLPKLTELKCCINNILGEFGISEIRQRRNLFVNDEGIGMECEADT